jgi:monothiol glutaredoxin
VTFRSVVPPSPELSSLSGWPTVPQLFVEGELVGGCDIVMEMYQSGELHQVLGIEGDATPVEDDAPLSIENRL